MLKLIYVFLDHFQEDVKNWSIDVFMDALTRAEETAKKK